MLDKVALEFQKLKKPWGPFCTQKKEKFETDNWKLDDFLQNSTMTYEIFIYRAFWSYGVIRGKIRL
jgi:hypothetical protein